jgi:signal transduction histidine kinase
MDAARSIVTTALRRPVRPPAAMLAAVLAACLATALLGLATTRAAGGIATLWLPNAILIAVLLRTAPERWLALLAAGGVANAAAELLYGDGPDLTAGLTLANLLEVALAATAVRAWCGERIDLLRFGTLLRFGIAVVLGAPLAAATVGAAVLHLVLGVGYGGIWRVWYGADVLGALTVTPLVLAVWRPAGESRAPRQAAGDLGLSMIVVVAAVILAFSYRHPPMLFVVYPALLLAVFRGGALGAALGVAIVTVVATAYTAAGHGPITEPPLVSTADRVLFLQLYIATLSLSLLPIAAALARRDRLEGELREARDRADRASRAKSDFLASMSHELRTPLNAILGFGQLMQLQREEPLNARHGEYVGHILGAGRTLLEMVDEVLDLAHIETGALRVATERIELEPLLDAVAAAAAPLAAAKGQSFAIAEPPPGAPAVRGDPQRLRQVLASLAGNAVKFSRPGDSVRLEIAAAPPGRWRISVVDTGVGIPPGREAELFQPFSRLGQEGSGVEGAGLGLAISRRLVELMGGTIGFARPDHQGSRFWIELPAAPSNGVSPPSSSASGAAAGTAVSA